MWGNPVDDRKKNFTGLVGDLVNGYPDVGWANLFFNLDQSKIMDYTDAYTVDYLAWMVNKMHWKSNIRKRHFLKILLVDRFSQEPNFNNMCIIYVERRILT